jgi:hypothetical protein
MRLSISSLGYLQLGAFWHLVQFTRLEDQTPARAGERRRASLLLLLFEFGCWHLGRLHPAARLILENHPADQLADDTLLKNYQVEQATSCHGKLARPYLPVSLQRLHDLPGGRVSPAYLARSSKNLGSCFSST